MSNIIDDLRDKIDGQHRQALQALEVLKVYLASVSPSNGQLPAVPVTPGSVTEKVLGVISQEWATASTIASKIGLTIRNVRGVLNAPRFRGKFKRKSVGGEMAYRLLADEQGAKEGQE